MGDECDMDLNQQDVILDYECVLDFFMEKNLTIDANNKRNEFYSWKK